jgi:hypothetical protein
MTILAWFRDHFGFKKRPVLRSVEKSHELIVPYPENRYEPKLRVVVAMDPSTIKDRTVMTVHRVESRRVEPEPTRYDDDSSDIVSTVLAVEAAVEVAEAVSDLFGENSVDITDLNGDGGNFGGGGASGDW